MRLASTTFSAELAHHLDNLRNWLISNTGNFSTSQFLGTNSDDRDMVALADVNRDGSIDVVAGGVTFITVWLDSPSRTFPATPLTSGSPGSSNGPLHLADFHPNAGAPKVTKALANPTNYVEAFILADPTQTYKLWVRLRAENNYWGNDSIFVQVEGGTVTQDGQTRFATGTTDATNINLERCSGCGIAGWGWRDERWGGQSGRHARAALSERRMAPGPDSDARRRRHRRPDYAVVGTVPESAARTGQE
jgi:hypothetical protein